MTAFVFRRLLLALPTVLIVFIICFFLSRKMPGDEVDTFIGNNTEAYSSRNGDIKLYEESYKRTVLKLGLNKPVFYWSLITKAYPDTFNSILYLPQKEVSRKYLNTNGNWPLIQAYFIDIDKLIDLLIPIPDSLFEEKGNNLSLVYKLKTSWEASVPINLSSNIKSDSLHVRVNDHLLALQKKQLELKNTHREAGMFYPKLVWNSDNQFHNWFSSIFNLDLNVSLIDGQPTWTKIGEALKWTLIINLLALSLALFIAIKLGKYLALKQNTRTERIINSVLFSVYTIPTFWIGSLLIIFFTNSEYGDWMHLFPAGGIGKSSDDLSIFNLIVDRLHHFILPILCLSYPVIAYLSSHVRDGLKEASKEPWFTTALSKGLSRKDTFKKHGLKNALFPLISLLGQIIPSLISGSIIIEVLFNIPGMGRLMFTSVLTHDWPVVYNIVIITALIVVVSQVIVDLLYRVFDPRLSTTE